jgi:hypothetical protein
MNDQNPVCTNNKTGPFPTSVTAILEPSICKADVSNGHTVSGSQYGRWIETETDSAFIAHSSTASTPR